MPKFPTRTYAGTGKYTSKAKLMQLAKFKKGRARRRQVWNRTSVPVGLGFPKRMTMTLKYAETGTLATGGTGGLNTYSYVANGLYDPNNTGAGHQPMYFDQMMGIYNHYVVIGSKCTVTWAQMPDTAGSRPPVTVGIFLNDDSVVTPGINGLLENSKVKHRTMTQNTGVTATTVMKYSAKKMWGGSILAAEDQQGTSSVNPAEQAMFTLFIDSAATATECTIYYKIVIEYITVFRELKDIASS